MCLAIPALLLQRLPQEQGLIELGGIRKTISLALVPEAVAGDYVIVHVGYAIGLLDPIEAQRTLELFEAIEHSQAQPPQPSTPTPPMQAAPQAGPFTP